MPELVANGAKPDSFACGFCHLPSGRGRPENAPIAGLPASYIVRQVEEMASGVRKSALPDRYPQALMTTYASTLAAISAGAVFMGANSYIGNAPNLMVKAIAEDRGGKMPSFFGYMLWSVGILIPLFVAVTFLFFR